MTLGLFLIVSFIVGHAVQGVGNLIEWAEDQCGTGLRDMPFAGRHGGVGEAQWQRFLGACERRLGVRQDDVSKQAWPGIRKEVMALLGDGATRRIEAFNRTYGLCRGISASCILTTLMILALEGRAAWGPAAALLAGALVMHLRKRRFGKLYLQEVVARFVVFDAAAGAISSPQDGL